MRVFINKPTGRPKSLLPETEQLICEEARANPYFSYRDLARRYDTTSGTVRNTLKRFDIPLQKRYNVFSFPTTRFWKIHHTAKKRGLTFDLTMPYLEDLFRQQDERCPYTGWRLSFSKSSTTYEGTASLDRIDSTKGYVMGNVQWVHKHINLMKLWHSHEDFIEMCKTVARQHGTIEPNQEAMDRLAASSGYPTNTWRQLRNTGNPQISDATT